jgi:hypothetical protein
MSYDPSTDTSPYDPSTDTRTFFELENEEDRQTFLDYVNKTGAFRPAASPTPPSPTPQNNES